ncbi:potassium voltage-gated channel subfamily A member 1-like [Mytilus edulis]|uniref:potassium voltage-gated channel subfamily A member 1-like n=1 Tax=Mytilus edulis TaxID=6550 RepID=UPI0039EEE054
MALLYVQGLLLWSRKSVMDRGNAPRLTMDDDTVRINVNGTMFTTRLSTVQKYPDTLLGSISFESDCYSKDDKSFYFDRNPELFNTILDYYRNGCLHLPNVFSFIYLSTVLVSASFPCLKTHPGIRIQTSNATTILKLAAYNNVQMWMNKDNHKEMQFATTKEPNWLYYWSLVICIFFSVETILRVLTCSTKNKFVKEWLNILDIILFVIMWICYGIKHAEKEILSNKHLTYFLCFCEAVSVLRLFKFFRLAKQYSSLRILFIAVQSSARELLLLLITFFVFGWMFANLVYYTEILESESFPNMLVGFWWSVVTMTTVGYGDVYPVGPLGRVVGVLCSLCGLLVLAMPIAIIAGNFDSLCRHNEEREAYVKLQTKQKSNIPKAWETSKIDPNYPIK